MGKISSMMETCIHQKRGCTTPDSCWSSTAVRTFSGCKGMLHVPHLFISAWVTGLHYIAVQRTTRRGEICCTHEDQVGQGGPVAFTCNNSSCFNNLLNNLRGGQIGEQAHTASQAELAIHSTPNLSNRNADLFVLLQFCLTFYSSNLKSSPRNSMTSIHLSDTCARLLLTVKTTHGRTHGKTIYRHGLGIWDVVKQLQPWSEVWCSSQKVESRPRNESRLFLIGECDKEILRSSLESSHTVWCVSCHQTPLPQESTQPQLHDLCHLPPEPQGNWAQENIQVESQPELHTMTKYNIRWARSVKIAMRVPSTDLLFS